MLFLVPSILLFCAVFYGIGFLVSKFLRIEIRQSVSLTAFLGICFASLFFSLAQFFTPLNIATFSVVLLLSFYGLYTAVKKRNFFIHREFLLMDIILILIVSAYVCSYEQIFPGDTMGYHLTVVSWLNAYKIVPGLANLHFRLGMNSAYLILAAGIDVGIFDKLSSSILPAVFSILTIRYFFEFIIDDKLSKEIKLLAVVLFAWLVLENPLWMLSPNLCYDISAQTFIVITVCEFLIRNQEIKSLPDTSFPAIFIFATMSFAIKQMGAVMVLVIFFIGCVDIVQRKGRFKDFVIFITVPAVFGITYIVRNIIQTGYPLYPLPVLGLNVKWAARSVVLGCYESIKCWARMPSSDFWRNNENTGFFFWFLPWFKLNIKNNMIYFTTLLVALILSVRITFVSKISKKGKACFVTLMTIYAINIIFWFTSAPDFRFGSVFFFLPLAVACYFSGTEKTTYIALSVLTINIVQMRELARGSINNVFLGNTNPWTNWLWCIIIGLTISFVFLTNIRNRHMLAMLLLLFVLLRPYNGGLRKRNPVAATSGRVKKIILQNEQFPPLEVYIPETGDSLGDAPLPCTPYPTDKLHLIEPGDMEKGFYIDEEI